MHKFPRHMVFADIFFTMGISISTMTLFMFSNTVPYRYVLYLIVFLEKCFFAIFLGDPCASTFIPTNALTNHGLSNSLLFNFKIEFGYSNNIKI